MDKKYIEVLQVIINKQISLFGLTVISKRAILAGISLDTKGEIIEYKESGNIAVAKIIEQIRDLAGDMAVEFSRKAAEPVLNKFPDIQFPH